MAGFTSGRVKLTRDAAGLDRSRRDFHSPDSSSLTAIFAGYPSRISASRPSELRPLDGLLYTRIGVPCKVFI